MPYETPPWTQVIAHRGNSGPLPENTMVAIEGAIGLGVEMVEVDVRLTKDEVPILMHHDRVDDTTSGTGRVSDLTWDELKTLDAGVWRGQEFAGERVRALDEVLSLTRGRVALNLDIKVPEAAAPTVIAAIKADVCARVVISGCTAKCLQTVWDLTTSIAVLFNLDELLLGTDPAEAGTVARRGINLAVESGAMAINVPHRLVDAALVDQARDAGIGVWAFTVDEESRFRDLIDAGVDSLTTNWPERMLPLARSKTSPARRDKG